MLAIRQRGSYWHMRGTVRAEGKKKERVPEQSTGCDSERAARAFADNHEREIKARLTLNLPPPKPELVQPFSEAVANYVTLTSPKKADLWRVARLLEGFKDTAMNELGVTDWTKFCTEQMPGTAANTRARMQTTLRDVFACNGVSFPTDIKHKAERVERVRWLQKAQAETLTQAYGFIDPENGRRSAKSPHAKAIALTLRFLGVRSSECLQIQRTLLDDARGPHGAIFIEPSKNGLARWVPLHERVREAWEPLLSEKRPTLLINGQARDPLFLTDKGKPYRDPRQDGSGGNPFARAHRNACGRAGVTDFTPHDWRHHWASWHVREGMDLRTLQDLGGWLDLSQVQRYAGIDWEDAAKKQARAS